MRLFIAIDFDKNMRKALKMIQEDMRSFGLQGRFSPIENLHLTLAFVGEYSDPDDILDIMDQIPFEPTEISLDGLGRFLRRDSSPCFLRSSDAPVICHSLSSLRTRRSCSGYRGRRS